MTPLQLELTRLIGFKKIPRKTMDGLDYNEIESHCPTLSDLHRWILKTHGFEHGVNNINLTYGSDLIQIPYDSSKDLLDQEESILEQIISLIKSNQ